MLIQIEHFPQNYLNIPVDIFILYPLPYQVIRNIWSKYFYRVCFFFQEQLVTSSATRGCLRRRRLSTWRTGLRFGRPACRRRVTSPSASTRPGAPTTGLSWLKLQTATCCGRTTAAAWTDWSSMTTRTRPTADLMTWTPIARHSCGTRWRVRRFQHLYDRRNKRRRAGGDCRPPPPPPVLRKGQKKGVPSLNDHAVDGT